MFWTPEPLFAGQDVFVVGGGSSLRGFDFTKLRGRRAVAVNAAGYFVRDADVLYFRDYAFVDSSRDHHHKALVLNWSGIAVTQSAMAADQLGSGIKLIEQADANDFNVGRSPIKIGRSGGHTAVSLAIAMGAKRVILLGIDCRISEDGRSHFHDSYCTKSDRRYRGDFLKAWDGWDAAARRAGVSILNANRASAVREFEFCDIDQILGGG